MNKKFNKTLLKSIIIIGIGISIGGFGIRIGEIDDSPGAALSGILFMSILIIIGIKLFLKK